MKTDPNASVPNGKLNKMWLTWVTTHTDALTITVLLMVLIFETLYLRGWTYPIFGDRSFHLYSAQEIARGRIPYADFFNLHPPLALILLALPMWVFPKLMTGAGPAYVHITWTVLWTAVGIVATYYIGKRLTSSRLGGALAGWLLVGLTPLLVIYAAVGENRLLVMSAMALAVVFMQRDRWFWAGLAIGIGSMTYYPTILAVAGAGVLFTGKRGPARWRGLGHFGLGLAVPIAFITAWLATRRALWPWISVTLLWPIGYLGQISSGLAGEGASGLGSRLSHSAQMFSLAFSGVGNWILIAAALSCLAFIAVALVRTGRRPAIWSDQKTLPLAIVPMLYVSYTLVEIGPLDPMLALPFISAWAAFGITSLSKLIEARQIGFRRAGLIVLTAFSLVSSGRMLSDLRQKISLGQKLDGGLGGANLQTQIKTTEALETFLPSEYRELVMGDLWPLVISGQENVIPFYHSGPKMRLAAQLSGMVADSIFQEVLRAHPEFVLFTIFGRGKAEYDQLAALLTEDGYVCVGLAHRLGIFISPDDAQALASAVAMRQALFEEMSQSPEEISLAQVASMTNVQIREVAPGMLLIAHELLQEGDITELILYWWTWMPVEQQTEIQLEVLTPEGIVDNWQVARSTLPPNKVTKERIALSEVGGLPEDSVIRLVPAAESPVKKHPCRIEILQEPVVLNVETGPSSATPEPYLTHGPLVGAVTDTSAVIWMRAEAPPDATIVAKLATESTFENALTFSFSSSGPDATWKANATGLHPHTTYYVDIEINGESQMRDRYSKFTTFVPRGESVDLRFAVLTDFFGNQDSGVFEQVARHEPSLDFVYLGGDFWHRNIDDIQGKRDRFKFMYSLYTPRGYAGYFVHGILSQYPVAHCYDDHDMGVDNADKTYPKKAETLQVLQEFFPTYPMSPHGCWQKFSYGQADFFILDTRSQRDPKDTPDGPNKSLLDGDEFGDEGQWRWLENGLLNSTAKWKFIFSGSPFNPTTKKRDAWYGYPDERDRLIELIRSNGIQGIVIISGDIHAGGIDDGTNAGLPEIVVPAANTKGCLTASYIGNWSHGFYSSVESGRNKTEDEPPCPGYGVVSVMTDPDRILMQVKNDEGETELEMLYSLNAD